MSILIGKNSFDSLQADVCYILPLKLHAFWGATKEISRRFLHTGLLIMLIMINFFPSKSASSQVWNLTASKTSIFFPLVMSEDTGQIRKGESECKNRDNVFLHCSLAWICVDFSCKTAFISYHVMSAKTRVLKCCCLLFDWTEFWESSALSNHESWLAYGDFKEKTWLDHSTKRN